MEIPASRALGLPAAGSNAEANAYLEGVARQASVWPGTVTEGRVTYIVSADGRVIKAYEDPWFGYSNLWNGYSPLRRLGVHGADLADLQNIPDEVIQKALDEDIRSVWCLDLESWDGTELESERG